MGQIAVADITPEHVLAFWFPKGLENLVPGFHARFWRSRMRGEMDEAICTSYANLTHAGARGELDHWADTAEGRLALILVLDQFPRSLWRGTPAAYAQDAKATRLALQGIGNGHYAALEYPWQRNFYLIAISHCEGPDLAERMDMVVDMAVAEIAEMSDAMRERYGEMDSQPRRVRDIIRRFGRHPHRNPIYGRVSTPEEEAYIAAGEFPHEREIRDPG